MICDHQAPCTDETLASITALLSQYGAVVHAVASANLADRTPLNSLDPWLVAQATGASRSCWATGTSISMRLA